MNPFHCPHCCSLLGYFASAAVMLATYAAKCFYCRGPLDATAPKTHVDAMQARAAKLAAPAPAVPPAP